MALNQNSPPLWLIFSLTFIQLTFLTYMMVKFNQFIEFCRSCNSSGNYVKTKNTLLVLFYSFVPLTIVCIAFMWISYDQDWAAGYGFTFPPFVPIILFLFVLMLTRNDVSNFVDVQRNARSRLPSQPLPMPMQVGEVQPGQAAMSPGQDIGAKSPMLVEESTLPALPLADDEDAF